MEFVLNTTTSTPESSRSGSFEMKFGDYKEGDEIAVSISSIDKGELQVETTDSDDDSIILEGFDIEKAKNSILSQENCIKLHLNEDQQRYFDLIIGKHVTQQELWKSIEKNRIDEFIAEREQSSVANIVDYLFESRADQILVGYISPFLGETDDEIFLFCFGEKEAETIIEIVRLMEAKNRQNADKILYKYSRPWESLGSEAEVNRLVEKATQIKMDIEVQSVQFDRTRTELFVFRMAEDIRDGYVELLCNSNEMSIREIDKIDVSIQTTSQLTCSDQQTDPTFPANACTQYHYDVEDDGLSEYEETAVAAIAGGNTEKKANETDKEESSTFLKSPEPFQLSDAMMGLINILKFNSIDVYRDDYAFISKKSIKTFTEPYLTECFSFIDAEMCKNRCVNSISWNPFRSEIFAVSYTFETYKNILPKIKKIKRYQKMKKQSMYSNPVLIWSLLNELKPLLKLETPYEVTCLSFCPYDEDLIIGGLANGQLIFWDLKTNEENNSQPIDLHNENRERLNSLLGWDNLKEKIHPKIKPAALSPREYSHKKPITSIKWFHRKHFVTSTGQLKESVKPTDYLRHFVSASIDGGINFWDLDYIVPTSTISSDLNKGTELLGLINKNSTYNRLNGVIRPVYMLSSKSSITDLVIDDGDFVYQEVISPNGTVDYTITDNTQNAPTNKIITSTLLGTIDLFTWEGYLCKEGKPEVVKQIEQFAPIHDGPVLKTIKNPFISEIVLSIGGSIFAVWNTKFPDDPLIWRINNASINCCQWSSAKASLFFTGYSNGKIEVWDFLVQTNSPLLTHKMGNYSITAISQHILPNSNNFLSVGDHRGAIRVLWIPELITKSEEDNINKMDEFCKNILKQKHNLKTWQDIYSKNNQKPIELKALKGDLSKRTIEHQLEEVTTKNVQTKTAKDVNRQRLRKNYNLSERMQKKWESAHLKRLQNSILEQKRFDPDNVIIQMKPELENIEYQKQKHLSIENESKKYNDELDDHKTRLIPSDKIDEKIERWNLIIEDAAKLLESNFETFKYETIERDLLQLIEQKKKEHN